ncbi:uncharacterized protein LOC141649348 [Silene latifolia]|uniref:uncharacterized protein LOC141649348 n=1 Tax=Silene latifolia TaxID=37657 RepID=UPI003D784585
MPQVTKNVKIEELDVDAEEKFANEAAVTPEKSRSTETDDRSTKSAAASNSDKGKSKAAEPPTVIKVPFPGRLKNTKVEQQFGKFLEVVKNLQRSFNEAETIAFTEECSALLQSKSSPKLKDPGSFSIPCTIGTHVIDKALCDLDASVSFMPYSICEKLNIGHLKVTNVTLQMVDRTAKCSLGVLEDAPVKICKFFIPVDFIVLDMADNT